MNASISECLAALAKGDIFEASHSRTINHPGLGALATQVIDLAGQESAQLELLKALLTWSPEPDPFAEQLLELGEKLALSGLSEESGSSEMLGEAFGRKREAYRLQFASLYALEAIGDAVTDYFLSKTTVMQPFAASSHDEFLQCKVLRLKDVEAARFESKLARLFDLTEPGLDYEEIMLEFDNDALNLLQSIDTYALSLRFVYDHAYFALSTKNSSLFDVEVNLEEKRLYMKLRLDLSLKWQDLDSIVVMDGNKP